MVKIASQQCVGRRITSCAKSNIINNTFLSKQLLEWYSIQTNHNQKQEVRTGPARVHGTVKITYKVKVEITCKAYLI